MAHRLEAYEILNKNLFPEIYDFLTELFTVREKKIFQIWNLSDISDVHIFPHMSKKDFTVEQIYTICSICFSVEYYNWFFSRAWYYPSEWEQNKAYSIVGTSSCVDWSVLWKQYKAFLGHGQLNHMLSIRQLTTTFDVFANSYFPSNICFCVNVVFLKWYN